MPLRPFARFLSRALALLLVAVAFRAEAFLTFNISFNPAGVRPGDSAYLILSINDSFAWTNGTIAPLTVRYPAGLVNDTAGTILNGCNVDGLAVAQAVGTDSFSLTGGNYNFLGGCTIYFPVVSSTPGTYRVTFPANGFSSSASIGPSSPVFADLMVNAPIMVTNVNPSGAGSLQDALRIANGGCIGPQDIHFNIPGPGPHVINVSPELSAITCPYTWIDGYTQPGAAFNTDPSRRSNNAVIQIVLSGASCGPTCRGLVLIGSYATIGGLSIHSFGGAGIEVAGSSSAFIFGNYIGTDPGGVTARPNREGILISSGYANIGSTGRLEKRNVISANSGPGIHAQAGPLYIDENLIGGRRDGGPGMGNSVGVFFAAGSFGGSLDSNVVRYNNGAGIAMDPGAFADVDLYANESYANNGPGFDLGNDGPTPNDEAAVPYDVDGGPNGLQNYPVITSVQQISGNTQVGGYIKTRPGGAPVFIQFFSNSAIRPVTEGENYLAGFLLPDQQPDPVKCPAQTFPAPLDCEGYAAWSFTIPGTYNNISAMVTLDVCGDGCVVSSEYSPAVAVSVATLTVTPASLVFGTQAVGTSSPPQRVTITNTGAIVVNLTLPFTMPAHYTVTTTCGPSLAPGATCFGDVVFTPTIGGTLSGTMKIASDATGSPHMVALTGIALTTRTLTVSPASMSFGTRSVNTTSGPATVTIVNSGSGVVTLGTITITGDFAFNSTCPPALVPAGTCTIQVTFTPLVVGTRNGTLSISSDATGSPHVVALAGNGVITTVAIIDMSPPAVEFAPQRVGTTSDPSTVTVANSGGAVLILTVIAISGDFILAAPPMSSSEVAKASIGECTTARGLAPGESCAISVAFKPTVEGSREGFLRVSSNATSQPAAVRLFGMALAGTPPRALSVQPTLDFGARPVGTQSAGSPLPIVNNTAGTVIITSIIATGDFTVSSACPTIAARATCSPLVFFKPSATGVRRGTLTLRTGAEPDPYVVELSGAGDFNATPLLSVRPTRLGYGNVLAGSAASATIELVNEGQVPVALGGMVPPPDFFATDQCGGVVAVGGRCTATVYFLPRTRGPKSGQLEIRSNAAGTPHKVDLSGTGCALPSAARQRVQPLLCSAQ